MNEIEYSIGENSLSKIIKYHQRESLLLETQSINDYIQILSHKTGTEFQEELEEKAKCVESKCGELEELCISLNEIISLLINQKVPTQEQENAAKDTIESIVGTEIIVDKEQKLTHVVDSDPVLLNLKEFLADIVDQSQFIVEKATLRRANELLCNYEVNDAKTCDIENEGRIQSAYATYERYEKEKLEALCENLEELEQQELKQEEHDTTLETEKRINEAENTYVEDFQKWHYLEAYNKSVLWAEEQLNEVIFKQDINEEYHTQKEVVTIENLAPKVETIEELIIQADELKSKLLGQLPYNSTEIERFNQLKKRFEKAAQSMSECIDTFTKTNNDSCEILRGANEDIYGIYENLEKQNKVLQEVEVAWFYKEVEEADELAKEINAFNQKSLLVEQFKDKITKFWLYIGTMSQNLSTEESESRGTEVVDLSDEKQEINKSLSEIRSYLTKYKELLFSQEENQARIKIYNKYIEKQESPYAKRYMSESGNTLCQECKKDKWEYVYVQNGYKYCCKCAERLFDEEYSKDGSEFKNQFIKAIFD